MPAVRLHFDLNDPKMCVQNIKAIGDFIAESEKNYALLPKLLKLCELSPAKYGAVASEAISQLGTTLCYLMTNAPRLFVRPSDSEGPAAACKAFKTRLLDTLTGPNDFARISKVSVLALMDVFIGESVVEAYTSTTVLFPLCAKTPSDVSTEGVYGLFPVRSFVDCVGRVLSAGANATALRMLEAMAASYSDVRYFTLYTCVSLLTQRRATGSVASVVDMLRSIAQAGPVVPEEDGDASAHCYIPNLVVSIVELGASALLADTYSIEALAKESSARGRTEALLQTSAAETLKSILAGAQGAEPERKRIDNSALTRYNGLLAKLDALQRQRASKGCAPPDFFEVSRQTNDLATEILRQNDLVQTQPTALPYASDQALRGAVGAALRYLPVALKRRFREAAAGPTVLQREMLLFLDMLPTAVSLFDGDAASLEGFVSFLLTLSEASDYYAMLALDSLLNLAEKAGLAYTRLYARAFSLLTVANLSTPGGAHFLRILDRLLRSKHIPQGTLLCFVRRLAQVALRAPADTSLALALLVLSILLRHKALRFLLAGDNAGARPLDAFHASADLGECEALVRECGARINLVELSALATHFHGPVRALCRGLVAGETLDARIFLLLEDALRARHADVVMLELQRKLGGRGAHALSETASNMCRHLFGPVDYSAVAAGSAEQGADGLPGRVAAAAVATSTDLVQTLARERAGGMVMLSGLRAQSKRDINAEQDRLIFGCVDWSTLETAQYVAPKASPRADASDALSDCTSE